MSKVTVIFVGGSKLIDTVIETVTHGTCSHTAIKILGGVLESQGIPDVGDTYPGVHLHTDGKYNNNAYAQFVDVDLPDLVAAEKKAQSLLGKFYSYIGCIEGVSYDIFGINLHPIINKFINLLIVKYLKIPINLNTGEWTMDCSETVTRILRAGGLDVLPSVDADCITPEDLLKALTGKNVSKTNNFKESDIMSEPTVSTELSTATSEITTTKSSITDVVNAAVETVSADAYEDIAQKIAELAKEIKTTNSLWVKVRNTVEIGTLSVLLSKAAAALSEKKI
ncbi:MAG: hypothetical protein K0R31_833 [Clostridiales bacterium]|nr:hypothetical protein [Clostridiales bacterium]